MILDFVAVLCGQGTYNLKRKGKIILFDATGGEVIDKIHKTVNCSFSTACLKHGFTVERTK